MPRKSSEAPNVPLTAEEQERKRLEGFGPYNPKDDPISPSYEPSERVSTIRKEYGNVRGGDGGKYEEHKIELTGAGERRKQDSEKLKRIKAQESHKERPSLGLRHNS